MSVMIQVRNVPDEVHHELKARAARAGMSLSDFVLKELERSLKVPTMAEWLARVRTRTPVEVSESVAEAIREERESR
jgi:plasmid stability protein